LADFYEQTGCEVTPEMMMWPVMRNFEIQRNALKETTAPPDIDKERHGGGK
jgi:hypothetical protein